MAIGAGGWGRVNYSMVAGDGGWLVPVATGLVPVEGGFVLSSRRVFAVGGKGDRFVRWMYYSMVAWGAGGRGLG